MSSLKFYNAIRFKEFKSRYEIQKSNEELSKVTYELEETNKKLRDLDKMKMRFFCLNPFVIVIICSSRDVERVVTSVIRG